MCHSSWSKIHCQGVGVKPHANPRSPMRQPDPVQTRPHEVVRFVEPHPISPRTTRQPHNSASATRPTSVDTQSDLRLPLPPSPTTGPPPPTTTTAPAPSPTTTTSSAPNDFPRPRVLAGKSQPGGFSPGPQSPTTPIPLHHRPNRRRPPRKHTPTSAFSLLTSALCLPPPPPPPQ